MRWLFVASLTGIALLFAIVGVSRMRNRGEGPGSIESGA